MKLVNFQQVDIGYITTCYCANGQYYGVNVPLATLAPGNSTIERLFNLTPYGSNRHHRGIVFESLGTDASFNEMLCQQVQCNAFGRVELSDTATMTNASANVTVADGTQYAVGMPVWFTTTNRGFDANRVYVVASVAGNTLTLANSRSEAVIPATSSGTMTMKSSGFANIELAGVGTARVNNLRIDQLDTEGDHSVGLYMERMGNSVVRLNDVPVPPAPTVVTRNVIYSHIESLASATVDFDGFTSTSTFDGLIESITQRTLPGRWKYRPQGMYALAVGPGRDVGSGRGDFHLRQGGNIYPDHGIGERIYPLNSGWTLDGSISGVVVFTSFLDTTMTLPTIVTDTDPTISHIGLWYEFANVSSTPGTDLTIQTGGGQLFNRVAAHTSLVLAVGQSVRITAAKDDAGVPFWFARAIETVA